MKALLLPVLLLAAATAGRGQNTFFRQEFLLGPDPASYRAADPTFEQFTDIVTSGSTQALLQDEKLCFNRQADGSGRFFRLKDFPGPPRSLYVQFRLSGSSTGTNAGAAELVLGQFSNGGSITPNSEVYAKIGFAATGGGWQLRHIGSGNVGPVITAEVLVTWVLNNTGARVEYINPDGSGITTIMQNDTYDLWVGGEKVLSATGPTNPLQTLSDFKMSFDAGEGQLCFDNFLIRDVSGVLPVQLRAFSGQVSAENRATLFWQTASESHAATFLVERSPDARRYETVGTRKAAGTSTETHAYAWEDPRPLTETTYYRLRQTDTDGQQALLRPIALSPQKAGFCLQENPVTAGQPVVVRAKAGAVFGLFTPAGRAVPVVQESTPQGFRLWSRQQPPAGIYLLQNRMDGQTVRVVID